MSGFHTPGSSGSKNSGTNPGIALFLSLYLLLLAFFILLNAISSFEDIKASKVMDSLSSTFSTLLSPNVAGSFSGQLGDVVASREFQGEMGKLFETAIPAAKVTMIQPGELMQVSMHADALFMPGSMEIRRARGALLDRLVASLSSGPESLRYRMEFMIGTGYATGEELPIGETLEMARAGAYAREVMQRGVPPRSLQVGFMYGDPKEIRINFRIVDENAAQVQFTSEPEPQPEPQPGPEPKAGADPGAQ